jgi:hypothetical protein
MDEPPLRGYYLSVRLAGTAIICILAAFGAAFLVARAVNRQTPARAATPRLTVARAADTTTTKSANHKVNVELVSQFSPVKASLKPKPKPKPRPKKPKPKPAVSITSVTASTTPTYTAPAPTYTAPTYTQPAQSSTPPPSSSGSGGTHHKKSGGSSGGSGTTTIGG